MRSQANEEVSRDMTGEADGMNLASKSGVTLKTGLGFVRI